MTDPVQQPCADDLSVRLGYRVLGALLLAGTAMMYLTKAVPLFSYPGPIVSSCARETRSKIRLLCEVGEFLLGMLPTPAQGPVLGLAVTGVSIFLLMFAWLLIKPLVACSGKTSEPDSEPKQEHS